MDSAGLPGDISGAIDAVAGATDGTSAPDEQAATSTRTSAPIGTEASRRIGIGSLIPCCWWSSRWPGPEAKYRGPP